VFVVQIKDALIEAATAARGSHQDRIEYIEMPYIGLVGFLVFFRSIHDHHLTPVTACSCEYRERCG